MLKLQDDRRYQEVLLASVRWALRFNADRLGTEHLVLALAEADGATAEVLGESGMSVEQLRQVLLDLLPPSKQKLFAPAEEEVLHEMGVDLPELNKELHENLGERLRLGRSLSQDSPAAAVLWLAEEQAERLGSTRVAPEHLLLGVLWHAQGRGMRMLERFLSGPELRRRLVERLDLPEETRTRYLKECESSERVHLERSTRQAANVLPTWDVQVTVGAVQTILSDGGRAALDGEDALRAFLAAAADAGFTVTRGSEGTSRTYYAEVNPRLRQAFVAEGIANDQGQLAGVRLADARMVPTWVDVANWPGTDL